MVIGFDAKRIYDNTTGLGNYSRSLMHNLLRWFPQYDYKLFVHEKYYRPSPFKYQNFVDKTIVSNHYIPDLWRSIDIVQDVKANGIDIFHGLSNELPFNMPENIKSIVTIHDIIFHKFPDYFPLLDRKLYRYKVKKSCEQARAIVAVSSNTRKDLIEDFKVPENMIFVIPPSWGREFEYEYTNWFTELLRQKYKIPFHFVLFVGSTSQRKNLKVVIDALEYPENSEFPLVVVTNGGDNLEEMENYIYNKEIRHRIFFLKNVPWYELPGIYKMAKCVVYPSFYEGFGLPIIEGLKMGIPAVASDNSSLREAGGAGATYVDASDVDGWVDAINKTMLDTSYANQLRINGKHHIQKFKPEVVTSALIDLYSWVQES
ncbi:MAG: glycosyltransferase family 4 protein [Chitinophagales bacterium]|nr:glycosyltransferase family 4 protein [Chitinophagales bacterium]